MQFLNEDWCFFEVGGQPKGCCRTVFEKGLFPKSGIFTVAFIPFFEVWVLLLTVSMQRRGGRSAGLESSVGCYREVPEHIKKWTKRQRATKEHVLYSLIIVANPHCPPQKDVKHAHT